MLYTTFDSPLGQLLAVGDGRALCGLYLQEGRTRLSVPDHWETADRAFAAVREQLDEYFAGARTEFALPLAMKGTTFQRRVWRALQDIPYAETITYGEQARRVGTPASPRAVGAANGQNPISVIVPCHRVIGADGNLTGYGGGLDRKRLLLDLEAGVLSLSL